MRGNYVSKAELSNFIARFSLLLATIPTGEVSSRTEDRIESELLEILEETLRIKIEAD